MIWCEDFHGAAIGMAKTKDLVHFEKLENPFIPFNRNAVLFPRKIDGLYALLSLQVTVPTRHSAVFLSVTVRIWNSGAVTAMGCPYR